MTSCEIWTTSSSRRRRTGIIRVSSRISRRAGRSYHLAEFIAAALNVNTMAWHTGLAATELESLVLDWMAQLLGLPPGLHGHIEDTASISTISALAGRARAVPDGAVLASEQANFSVEKAARLLGLEYRTLPVDDEFRMRVDAVAAELERGGVAAIVPTVGTTGTTAVDPVAPIADLCAAHGAWLHVDAAYAGSAAICPSFAGPSPHAERADSPRRQRPQVVLHPDGLFVFLDAQARPSAPGQCAARVPAHTRGRRGQPEGLRPGARPAASALKLWAVMRCYGRAGLQQHLIREHVRFADLFACGSRPSLLGSGRAASVLRRVLSAEGSDEENEALLERVNASGEMYISGTRLNGRYVLRLAVGNVRTTGRRRAASMGAWRRTTRRDRHDDRLPHRFYEPFRIVKDGIGPIPGKTILEKRRYALEHLDDVRRLLVCEPRGHADMYGCFHRPRGRGRRLLGVLFFHNAWPTRPPAGTGRSRSQV